MSLEKPTFSKPVLNMAERFQHLTGALGAPIVRAFAGSDSANYLQLQWAKQPHIPAEDLNLVTIPGDPEAGRLARNWKTAAVIATDPDELEVLEDREPESQHAVAYVSEGVVRVGFLPNRKELFGLTTDRGIYEVYAMAMRLGRDSLYAAMGLWVPKEKSLITVHPKVINPRVPTYQMEDRYPDVPLF